MGRVRAVSGRDASREGVRILDPVARCRCDWQPDCRAARGRVRLDVTPVRRGARRAAVRPSHDASFSRRSSRSPTSGLPHPHRGPLARGRMSRPESPERLAAERESPRRAAPPRDRRRPVRSRPEGRDHPGHLPLPVGVPRGVPGRGNIVRSRFSPRADPGSSSVARAFAARTSKARSSTKRRESDDSRNCSVPSGPGPAHGRPLRARGRPDTEWASRYEVAALVEPDTACDGSSSTWGDGFRSRPCSSRR